MNIDKSPHEVAREIDRVASSLHALRGDIMRQPDSWTPGYVNYVQQRLGNSISILTDVFLPLAQAVIRESLT